MGDADRDKESERQNKGNDYCFIATLAMNHTVVEGVFDVAIRKNQP